MMSVPKIIHYCWFGGGPISEQAERSLESWRRFAPDYEIRRWDESNFDIDECSFAKGAHSAGKWAFVSDYARFKVLYEHGGIYMDVGSELVKGIDGLIKEYAPLVGIERGSFTASTGLIAACGAHEVLFEEILKKYESIEFENTDAFCAAHTVNDMLTSTLIEHGYKRNGEFQTVYGWTFLPPEFFDPAYGFGGYAITENTYSVHKGSGSWCPPPLKTKRRIVHRIAPYVGSRPAQIIGRIVGEISYNGVKGGFSNLLGVTASVLGRGKARTLIPPQVYEPSLVKKAEPVHQDTVRIALVLPYFGSLPSYFRYWLESAGKNKDIDFLIFSDCDFSEYDVPNNVIINYCCLGDVKSRISDILDFRAALHKPYKLCDFRPLYGLIFSSELNDYDYWGHCDSDVIWGNLRKFIEPGLSGGYDRLLSNGHLCIYKNVSHINRFILTPPSGEHVTYKDVYRLSGSMGYDESKLLADNLAAVGGRQWDRDCFADVDFRTKQFVCRYKGDLHETVAFFRWKDGSLFGYCSNGESLYKKEYAYLHLQKRKMEISNIPLDQCVITPTEFAEEKLFDEELIPTLLAPDQKWQSYWRRQELWLKIKNNLMGYALLKAKKRLLNRGAK